MRKLTKAHFNYLARHINLRFLKYEKAFLEDIDNNFKGIPNFSWIMKVQGTFNPHQTPEVDKAVRAILDKLYEEVKFKKYEHFNHSFNCFMKRLCVELKKQNPKFVESKFREACTKGSIQ